MAELVASYPVGAFTDPQNGNAPVDADEVRANDDALRSGFNGHDGDASIHFQGSVVATRPAAGTAGRKWFASDTRQIFRDNGSSWEEIDYLNLTNGGTVAGATTFTGTLTSTSGSRTFGATTFSGTVTGTAAIFSSTISAAGATLTAALTGTGATFSGLVSANTGSFSGAVAVGGALNAQGGGVNVSGGVNPNLRLNDGTGDGFVQVVAGDINFTPRAGKAVSVSSDFNIGAGKFVVAGSTGDTTTQGTLNVQGAAGFALGNVSGRRRVQSTGASGFNLVGDDDGFADLELRALTSSSTITGGASIVATLNLVAGATAAIDWSGRSQFLSPSDGTVLMANNAGTGFSRLIFGGTSSSFPALKVNGTTLELRLGDDSAYGVFRSAQIATDLLNFANFTGTAKITGGTTGVVIRNNADSADNLLISDAGVVTSRSSITSGASIALAATGSLGWLTRSQFLSPSDGRITLQNNAGTDFGLLQFGGTTSSFPALKRSSATLQARLADDSAETAISAVGYRVAGTQVVGARSTGWAVQTGPQSKGDIGGVGAFTLDGLAALVRALWQAITTHGLIGV